MPENSKLEEILRLTKDNNRMLHSMRRNAFLWGVIKTVLYLGLFIVLPFWIYLTYVAPVVESTFATFEDLQGTSASAQAQLSQLQELFSSFDPSRYFGQ